VGALVGVTAGVRQPTVDFRCRCWNATTLSTNHRLHSCATAVEMADWPVGDPHAAASHAIPIKC
jgi:hypothetical protein